MAETIQLEVVTPERLVVNEAVEYIEIPGKTGYLGVLPGHAPLISELAAGELTYRTGNQTKRVAVAWGFAEVLQTKVTILAETAEKAEDIDTARAEAAKKRAEAELQKAGPEGNEEAQAALQRATARLDVAGKSGKQ
ncbi:MAG TPA: F0F1 ATP synthase subunit epsilon [Candidatus Angelobacter sp.]|nr:F0F1 ATP synthase subunit epsilon [Candidatus Angelobacter sp.]